MLGVSRKYSSHFRMYETFSRQSMITMDQSATCGDIDPMVLKQLLFVVWTMSILGMDIWYGQVWTWYGHWYGHGMDMPYRCQ